MLAAADREQNAPIAARLEVAIEHGDQVAKRFVEEAWEPGSKVEKWSDVDPAWPAEKISLFGPGTDSGTFDYFTEAICGETGASRSDYQASEDDNDLVKGVAGNKYALGYFGYAYYVSNKDQIKALAIAP